MPLNDRALYIYGCVRSYAYIDVSCLTMQITTIMKEYLIDVMCNEDISTYISILIDFVSTKGM